MSYEDFKDKLGFLESSNRYKIKHGSMLGRYQFSRLRLIDLGLMARDKKKRYHWLFPWNEKKFLLNYDNIQEITFDKHVKDYAFRILSEKYSYLVGKEKYKLAGLIAVAHLLGFSAMIKWANSNEEDKLKFVDGLNTAANKYYYRLKDCDIDYYVNKIYSEDD